MGLKTSNKIAIFGSLLLSMAKMSHAACDQTLSVGANLAQVIANAPSGSTLCLNAGNYGSLSLSNISKSPNVTLQSISGTGATLRINSLAASHGITFKNLTMAGLSWSGNENTNIKILNNIFTDQLYIYGNGNGTPQYNLVDGNTFDGISTCSGCREGRLQIYGGNDLVVSNNHFGKRGESDGIQWGGYGGIVGPGNIFEGLTQEGYTAHVDSIQQYGEVDHQTITGNYFINNTVCIGNYDGGAGTVVTNNVFIATDSNNLRCVLDFGSVSNLTFSHNTVNTPAMRVGAINYPTGSSGSIVNNIFLNNSFSRPGAGFAGTIDRNLYSSTAIAIGTNTVIGLPTFIGGSIPSTMAGYQLTSTSLGYRAGSDEKDMGMNYYGAQPNTPLALLAPTNLRLL